MKVVCAPDSFKESMSAAEAAAAMTRGVRSVFPIHRFDNEIRQVLMTAADSRVMYAVTRSKGLWKSTDAGLTWADLSSGMGAYAGALDNMMAVEDVAKGNSLVVASNYGLLRSVDGLARGVQNLLGSRQQVAALRVTHHQRGIERGKGQLRHDRAPVARAELPGTVASTAQRKPSQGQRRPRPQACEHAQPLTARTP